MQFVPTAPPTANLASTIRRLEDERQLHVEKIAEIDLILSQVGRLMEGQGFDSQSRRLTNATKARRGKFSRTGECSILQLITTEGNPDTARINAHWRAEGRRGSANVILLRLLKCGLIVREQDDSVRGSRYRLRERASHVQETYNGGLSFTAPPGLHAAQADQPH